MKFNITSTNSNSNIHTEKTIDTMYNLFKFISSTKEKRVVIEPAEYWQKLPHRWTIEIYNDYRE